MADVTLQFSVIRSRDPKWEYEVVSYLMANFQAVGDMKQPYSWAYFNHLHEAVADAGRRANEAGLKNYLDTSVFVDVDEVTSLLPEDG
ncbi:hypothetical protein N9V97_00865 [Luminiphilus sp.]|nr:hypothetical protein [Luminiphilus sp.]